MEQNIQSENRESSLAAYTPFCQNCKFHAKELSRDCRERLETGAIYMATLGGHAPVSGVFEILEGLFNWTEP